MQIWRNEILNETWIIIIHNGSTLQGDYTVKIASTGTGLEKCGMWRQSCYKIQIKTQFKMHL